MDKSEEFKGNLVENEEVKFDFLSPSWNEECLKLFSSQELIDGKPTVAGLRRISEIVIGPIVSSKPINFWPILNDKLGRATCHYEVTFWDGVRERTYGDISDVYKDNVDDKFLVFASALSATRAEARCLRKALKLRTVAIEEITNKDTVGLVIEAQRGTDDERINSDQKNFLDMKCKSKDINLIAFLKTQEEFDDIDQLTREQAAVAIKEFNKLVKSEIPEALKGYKPWRD